MKVQSPDKVLLFQNQPGTGLNEDDVIKEESFESSQMSLNPGSQADNDESIVESQEKSKEVLDQSIVQNSKRKQHKDKKPSLEFLYLNHNII